MRNIDGYAYDALPKRIKSVIRQREDDWQNWSDAQIVAWIYTELGRRYSMDPNYRYANEMNKSIIENDARNPRNFERRLSGEKVVCLDLVRALETVLDDVFGIKCMSAIDGSGPHEYNIVYINGKRIRLDLQQDLVNIQSGRKLEYFGQTDYYDGKNFCFFKQEELDELLRSIDYRGIPYKNDESYEKIDQLKDKDIPLYEKLEIVLLYVNQEYSEELPNIGYCEKVELFKKCILDYLYDEDDRRTKRFRDDNDIIHRTVRKNGKFISCFSVKIDGDKRRHYCNDGTNLKYNLIDEKAYNELLGIIPDGQRST